MIAVSSTLLLKAVQPQLHVGAVGAAVALLPFQPLIVTSANLLALEVWRDVGFGIGFFGVFVYVSKCSKMSFQNSLLRGA